MLEIGKSILQNKSTLIQFGLYLGLWIGLWLPIAVPLSLLLKWHPFKDSTPQQKLPLVASLYLVFFGLFAYAQWGLGVDFTRYGLTWDGELGRSLMLGVGLGALGIALTFGIETALGWLQWRPENWLNWGKLTLPLLALALWIAWTEELIFRGLLQTQLEQDYAQIISALIGSVIFALLHLLWERPQTLPQLPGLALMGLVLVEARWLNGGSIGLAWGLHAGWVWLLASLDSAELLDYPEQAPAWIVGWYRQPLAGLAGILCLLVTAGIIKLVY
jgi:membrane protease YdiL (CAAX protease family)